MLLFVVVEEFDKLFLNVFILTKSSNVKVLGLLMALNSFRK